MAAASFAGPVDLVAVAVVLGAVAGPVQGLDLDSCEFVAEFGPLGVLLVVGSARSTVCTLQH